MKPELILELVGYFASLLVLVSLLMTSVVKLRIINGIGSFIFAVYALCIHSYPTAVMNFALVAIDGYFLWKMTQQKVLFDLVKAAPGDTSLTYFLDHYKADIVSLMPLSHPEEGDWCVLVYADGAPVGLLVGTPAGDGAMDVKLDYSTPKYRDCSVGRYLYSRLPDYEITTLRSAGGSDVHNRYLETVGFQLENGVYTKNL